ncbi:hypothetical protein Misp01_66930 [Microtetraspora sp. NBRC 13810]|nr:hypothetical protein Misp01_66930 [Microtetraspora sp. NBRC 13810]
MSPGDLRAEEAGCTRSGAVVLPVPDGRHPGDDLFPGSPFIASGKAVYDREDLVAAAR